MSRSATAPLSHWYHACEAAMDADREDDKAAIACAVTSSGPGTLEPCLAHSDKACVCEISVVVLTVGSPAKTGVARIKKNDPFHKHPCVCVLYTVSYIVYRRTLASTKIVCRRCTLYTCKARRTRIDHATFRAFGFLGPFDHYRPCHRRRPKQAGCA